MASADREPDSSNCVLMALTLAWFPLQLLATLPLFTFLLVTWIFRTPLALVGFGLFFVERSRILFPGIARSLADTGNGFAAFLGNHAGSLLVLGLSLLLGAVQFAGGKPVTGLYPERLHSSGYRGLNRPFIHQGRSTSASSGNERCDSSEYRRLFQAYSRACREPQS